MLHYDPETGVFTWKIASGKARIGAVAGAVQLNITRKPSSYKRLRIGFNGTRYMAHRLAWLYVFGVWPNADVAHINCDALDNRIANLREATRSENQYNHPAPKNNTSGVKGVTWNSASRKWMAQIKTGGRYIYLGEFTTKEAAAAVRHAATMKYHGDFGRL